MMNVELIRGKEKARVEKKITDPRRIAANKFRHEMVTQIGFRGADKPVHSSDLSHKYNRCQSHLNRTIGDLIRNDGIKIGSSAEGFFQIRIQKDLDKAMKYLRQRAFKVLLRCAMLAETHIENVFHEAWVEYHEGKISKQTEKVLAMNGRRRKAA